ncbi:MAG: glutamate--tRNA ligase [Aestuariivita sp.]|nr:glutamate--tRNA ligase [Aestuariivita sp.]MCY4346710.1 glutamate--tRNA ligase [Aestuariivita sp.]
MSELITTRFAPSPTGILHLGGARTALFNWLYARGRNGRFLLRIEDTDRSRSTQDAKDAILSGLNWLGIDWDGEPISQCERVERHTEIAHKLLDERKAYKCFATAEEINAYRAEQSEKGTNAPFRSPWRNINPRNHPDKSYVIRIKAPREGIMTISDVVQGSVRIRSDILDDMILLRSDGTPVYMLAVVVDDHDMGISHVIRGDDHLSNTARQTMIYEAMEWPLPVWAHIPLIHGPDGKKLSKRHAALGVEYYQEMGYSAAAMRNYLTRLGWSHGDSEFFSDSQALEWFDITGVGKSPARLDLKKLSRLSGQHLASSDDATLLQELSSFCKAANLPILSSEQWDKLSAAMYCLKTGVRTYSDILAKAQFVLCSRPISIEEDAQKVLNANSSELLVSLAERLQESDWERPALEILLKDYSDAKGVKFGELASLLRVALAGKTVTPSIFDMMLILGRKESITRLRDVA